jgi:hypothetical protein
MNGKNWRISLITVAFTTPPFLLRAWVMDKDRSRATCSSPLSAGYNPSLSIYVHISGRALVGEVGIHFGIVSVGWDMEIEKRHVRPLEI